MRRAGWAVVAVVVLLAGTTVVAGAPAGAADLAVTVTPATDLVDGQTVRVAVTGAPPAASLVSRVCADTAAGARGTCAPGFVIPVVTDANGAASYDVTVDAQFVAFEGATADCRVAPGCALFTSAFNGREPVPETRTPLSFRPDGPLEPPPTMTVTPAADLVDGTVVRIEAAGFRPQARVDVAQCRAPMDSYEDCDLRQTGLLADADGNLRTDYDVDAVLAVGTGEEVDCRVAGACEMVATRSLFELEERRTARAALGFRPDGPLRPPPIATVTPDTGLVDGQEIAVTGSGFRPGWLAVTQCAGTGEAFVRCSFDWHLIETDGAGRLDTTFRVRTLLRTDAGFADCRHTTCSIAVLSSQGVGRVLAEVPLVFDPDGPDPALPELVVAPGRDLGFRSGVIVAGRDFDTGDMLFLEQCRLEEGLPRECVSVANGVIVPDATGAFLAGAAVTAVMPGPDGAEIDCRRIQCALVAGSFSAAAPGIAPLHFAGGDERPRRYLAPVFDEVEITEGVVYRSTTNSRGAPVDLKLDVYEPAGDRSTRRPTVMWMFGGYFGSGARSQLREHAMAMARRGYVSVAIDYRIRPEIFDGGPGCVPIGGACLDPAQIPGAITDARDDARAAMVWLHEHAAEYGIDTRAIAAAGWSAGAITALNLAHDATGQRPAESVPAAAVSLAGVLVAGATASDPPSLMLGGNIDSLLSLESQVGGCGTIRSAGATCDFVAYAGARPPAAADPCARHAVPCEYVLGRDAEHGFLFPERPDVVDHISRFLAREVLRPAGLLDDGREHRHRRHHRRHHRHRPRHGHHDHRHG
jgi:acetyl esterase/lipase